MAFGFYPRVLVAEVGVIEGDPRFHIDVSVQFQQLEYIEGVYGLCLATYAAVEHIRRAFEVDEPPTEGRKRSQLSLGKRVVIRVRTVQCDRIVVADEDAAGEGDEEDDEEDEEVMEHGAERDASQPTAESLDNRPSTAGMRFSFGIR